MNLKSDMRLQMTFAFLASATSVFVTATGKIVDNGLQGLDNRTNGSLDDSSPAETGDSDTGSVDHDRWAVREDLESRVIPVVFGLIFVIGLVGNGTLIVSVLANKVMRNIPNILIASLSLGDFLLIIVSVPLTSLLYTFMSWPFGTVGCKVNHYMQTLSLGVSVFTLTALSADRYVAIVDPMAKLTGCTQRTTIGIALAIWFLSAILAIPDAVVSTEIIYQIPNNTYKFKYCADTPESMGLLYPQIAYTIRFVIFFLLPVLIIGFFYVMMARMLIRSNESVPTESKAGAANHHRQIAARKKVARVVLSFVVIFIVCWLPRHIYQMWFIFDQAEYNTFWHIFKMTGFCLKFINSCVNPFALYFLSGQFRKYYNRYLFCCCRRVRYSSLDTSTMHSLHSTTRRASPTNMSLLHSQSMC
ncbi:hypothetical protein BsWGS_12964 [Bradybaena similaris]